MDYARAKTMIMEMLRTTEDKQSVQELLYLKAVASLNVDDLITAHYTVSELLEVRKGRILLLQAPKGARTIRRLTLPLPSPHARRLLRDRPKLWRSRRGSTGRS